MPDPQEPSGQGQLPPPYSLGGDEGSTFDSSNVQVQADGRVNINLESKIAQTLAQIIESQQEDLKNPPPDYDETEGIEEGDIDCPFRLNIVIQIVGSRGDVQPFIALGSALQRWGHRVRIATHDTFADFVRGSGLEFYPIGGDPAELMAYMVKNPGLIPQMRTLRDGEVKKKQVMVAKMLDGCWKSCLDDDPLCTYSLCSGTRCPCSPNVHYALDKYCRLGHVINRWRESINLDPVPNMEGPSLAEALNVPFTYCWSPALIPKPQDWPSHIDICGFLIRDTPTYYPPVDLEKFLQSGEPPVYIGFGSIVVSNPQKLINTVLLAVAQAGVRAIISKGWGNIVGPPDPNIYYIEDCPHEWLFQHVSAVVHHGGAGTTACGLSKSRPSVIVPFFGDQPFWGNMVARSGAGPRPIPYASLTVQNLADGIEFCLTKESKAAAESISYKMRMESGVKAAVNSFHRNLPSARMRCDIIPGQPAVLKYSKGKHPLNLSTAAVLTLIGNNKANENHFKSYKSNPIFIDKHRWDPVTGILSAATATGSRMVQSTGEIFYSPYKQYTRSRSPMPSESLASSSQLGSGISTSNDGKEAGIVTAGKMVGVVIDIPHAAAEGFRQVPRLYGDKPKEYEPVKNWKSGAVFAGKNFVDGMSEGFSGLITLPIKGGKEEGALGVVKGLAKGTIGLATKVPSAGIGLVAYPLHGITKSIDAAFRNNIDKAIVIARLRDGRNKQRREPLTGEEQNGTLLFWKDFQHEEIRAI
ncbi:UDP-glucuronosyl/UDP-glucosyltransferase [Penicillium cosmopolitanum]|uniref:UDP-glucuronosyl/UDP-glucosyltransferase n=1 Tax=Penicillium cosmopolitanum TaxID=1131564 RepID=A0A9W9VDZ7_9EURO|nr:UDP-glucuronosyl/UDP-glucosyltransferase [Penicillium cosmopolitanum]KAJ5378638.1 UDP-glucuronosyl/UDP-glucosyltransferase [Penicillium cosmopolitanum]